jgi:glycosyltransferase involved in cell wall biosynthesis
VDAFTARLLELLGDPTRARRMGEAGRARAERLFTWDAVAARMVERMAGARPPLLQ